MSDEKSLTVIEQREVDFYDDRVTAVLVQIADQEQVYVPIRPICESLGLAWSSQLQRVRRDPVLNAELVSVFVTNTESQRGDKRAQRAGWTRRPNLWAR